MYTFFFAYLKLLRFYEAAVISIIFSPCLEIILDKEDQTR